MRLRRQCTQHPASRPVIICKQCGAPVRWVRIDGRWHCHNPDGGDHWDLCSKLRFERIKREGEHFAERREYEFVEGYRYKDAEHRMREQLVRIEAKKRPAQKSVLAAIQACKQCVPPWQECLMCPSQL